jgi:2-hydroxychromene-2-carboxylate isomerase
MAQPIDFAFDYASPWSYLANATLPRHFDPARVRYVPVYLRGFESFKSGVPYTSNKLAYLLKDMVRSAAHLEVPVTMPPAFPINGLYALRAALAAQRDGGFPAYHAAMFRAAWAEGRDVSSRDVVAAIAREVGAPGAAEGMDDPAIKEALRTGTEAIVARGAFGVPTFFVGDEMYWGHDRMHFAAAEARR